jgi:MoxR-like ATPase
MPDAVALIDAVSQQLIGKPQVAEFAVTCLIAEGHLLIEDRPGTGKTTLARALAACSGGTDNRIQFTPDLLPTDVTGVSIYIQGQPDFEFRPGPVFANVILADEINRASPKTQAALLEVMEERQVTTDGKTRKVPRPFMVVATQNPIEMEGTYRLPEAQLDRFLMRISIGYLDPEAELGVITGAAMTMPPRPVLSTTELQGLIQRAASVMVSDQLGRYIVSLASATRNDPDVRLGVSARGGLALVRACRARAVIQGRDLATADDVHHLIEPVWAHRLLLTPQAELNEVTADTVLQRVLNGPVGVPEGLRAQGAWYRP